MRTIQSSSLELFAHSARATRAVRIILVDTQRQQERLVAIATEITAHSNVPVSLKVLATRNELPADSLGYQEANVVISAVSTPYK